MSSRRTLVSLACFFVLLAGTAAGAQDGASTSIDGFNGIPWGSAETLIRELHGEPDQVDSLDNGILVLAYREELLGEPAVAYYALLGEHGMVKGQHIVKLDLEGGNCEGQYRVYRNHVTLAYPLIPPVENYDYPFTEDFCTAIENQRGQWANQWTDPSNGAVVTVIVPLGSDQVMLIYESSTFLMWLDPDEGEEG
jgi:hypothetical protein